MVITSNGLWLNRDGRKICYNPWTHFEVNNPNGNVTMCVDNGTILGNINEQSIEEIWNGRLYQEKRRLMFEKGAEKMCSPNCLLINGMKEHQSFSWYREVPEDTALYRNACLNEEEISHGKVILQSKPRWMRFTPSYHCNYRCYHCYQKDDRTKDVRLPAEFLKDVKGLAQYYQVLFIFGGEPTIFPEFSELLKLADANPEVRLAMVTNASNLHKFAEQIKRVKWIFIAVSLDAATPEMYKELRHSNQWEQVNKNLLMLSELRRNNGFRLNLGMTLNSINYRQVYDFVKLSNSYGATPQISLVCNPDGLSFYKKYLWFNGEKRNSVLKQIDRALQDFSHTAGATGFNVLRRHFEGGSGQYYLRQAKEVIKIIIPAQLIKLIKSS
jgi:MoaA/NifB/PqqE/SkfB family radical SAM enzyme